MLDAFEFHTHQRSYRYSLDQGRFASHPVQFPLLAALLRLWKATVLELDISYLMHCEHQYHPKDR